MSFFSLTIRNRNSFLFIAIDSFKSRHLIPLRTLTTRIPHSHPPMDNSSNNNNNNKDQVIEDPEKKKKKEEKAREKQLKKEKFLQKQAQQQQAQQSSNAPKKSEKKAARRGTEDENPEDFIDPETPSGDKKRMSRQMAKQYSPTAVEKSWYEWWENSKYFVADSSSSKPPFVIVLPPPNVTGALHIGHALTAAIEDTMIRWRRMSGYNALWVPGMDHAGIATQVVVEKKIMRERKLTRHDLGREKFISEVWEWKDKYGGTILQQLRRLGASLDWTRECFTMDDQRSKAVTEAFVRLYKQGLIYRDIRLVNWDCVLRTAVSDIEVDYIDIKERTLLKVPGYDKPVEFGVLMKFAYPLEGNLGEIIVATTRIETMLGDTAIAVHPDDQRYSQFHGKCAIHPFSGRKLPIVCDAILVDPTFAREAIAEALQKKGLYRGSENNEMRLGVCSRSNDVIEPMIKPQWYVSCGDMAKEGLNAATDEENIRLEIVPKQYLADWKRWLENIRDWCISRQLWWGHQIPAWYVTLEDDQLQEYGVYNDHWVVARNEEEAQAEASQRYSGKKFHLIRDPDVLDTWFSSGLFPLSVLGWPDDTKDLKTFYPTSVLETGHDILFFWVARMVMMGMKLGGDLPFKQIYLHPMIRDAHGRKMSKSLGNVIDPIEVINGISLEGLHKRLEGGNLDPKELAVAIDGQKKDFPNGIEECGADALRFALVSYTAQSDKINLDIQRVVGYRQWCNKLWNAIRFAMSKLGDNYIPPANLNPDVLPFSCQWILSVLNKTITKTIKSLESFEFSHATTAVYSWWQYQLCDVFIEVIKPYFAGNDPKFAAERRHAQDTLWFCLDNGLRLLHPFMPFVTEELWQRLPSPKECKREDSIMICPYPSPIEGWNNEKVENDMDLVESTVKSLRSLAKESRDRRPAFVLCLTRAVEEIISSHQLEIVTLANLSSLTVINENDAVPSGYVNTVVNETLSVYLELQGTNSAEAEQGKMKKIEELKKQIEKLEKIMSAPGYEEKVLPQVRAKNQEKLDSLKERLLLEETTGLSIASK
ncbi:Valine--tRNA ligase, mitochondrial 1 [Stylosanthes scabra]|uniref:valine--tRNA ligase n=1 Tax=Stylosanthes scabra TaxID=79078 RepID=A0ABU6S8A9_9FABA|nr:Valine--tRNA ligase, mitochondrial 1 [Stylosanthes scabra]